LTGCDRNIILHWKISPAISGGQGGWGRRLLIKSFLRLLCNPFERGFLWSLVLINFLGSIYGFYWYRFQLAETPWYYLIFIPDSPLSSSLFTIALITIIMCKRSSWLELLAYFWVIKYGIWAVILNLDVNNYGQFGFDNLMLTISHAGMAVEGFLFLRHLKYSVPQLLGIVLWLGINDYMDYVVGLHPWLFDPGQLGLAQSSAIGLSVLLVLLGTLYLKNKNLT